MDVASACIRLVHEKGGVRSATDLAIPCQGLQEDLIRAVQGLVQGHPPCTTPLQPPPSCPLVGESRRIFPKSLKIEGLRLGVPLPNRGRLRTPLLGNFCVNQSSLGYFQEAAIDEIMLRQKQTTHLKLRARSPVLHNTTAASAPCEPTPPPLTTSLSRHGRQRTPCSPASGPGDLLSHGESW